MSLSKLLLSVGKKALTKQAKTPTTGAVATRPMEMGSVTPATAKPIFGSTTFDRIAQKVVVSLLLMNGLIGLQIEVKDH